MARSSPRRSSTTGDSNFDAQISRVTAANPDAIALITFDQAKIIAPALVGAGYPGDKLYFVDGNLADYSADFAPGLIAGSKGTLPGPKLGRSATSRDRLLEVNPDLTDFSYAAESYDATMLLALASYAANSTDGTEIAKYLQQVSGGSGDGEKVAIVRRRRRAPRRGQADRLRRPVRPDHVRRER